MNKSNAGSVTFERQKTKDERQPADFTNSDKGFHTLSRILKNAGIPCRPQQFKNITGEGNKHDANNLLLDPSVDTSKKSN